MCPNKYGTWELREQFIFVQFYFFVNKFLLVLQLKLKISKELSRCRKLNSYNCANTWRKS